jgi:response regulator
MKEKVHILIVEDEKNISDILKFNLEKESYDISQRFDGKEGLDFALKNEVDLILLDIMLPSMDGFEICKQIRKVKNTPIIMLTAKEEEVDKVLGLELGADDYITKPFSVREVVARVKANVRRVEMIENSAVASQLLKFKDIEIDVSKYIVKVRGVEIKITFREFELLKFLAQHRDQVYSREQLLTIVWEYEYIGVDSERTVDVTVRRLREKIETDPSNPEFVITKRGVGYYFAGIPV